MQHTSSYDAPPPSTTGLSLRWLGALSVLAAAAGIAMSTFACTSIGSGGGGNVVDGRFVVCGLIVTPTGLDGYAAVVPGLRDDDQIDLADALPTGERSTCFRGAGALYVRSGEAPELTRYSVSDTGVFAETGRLSFAGEGVTTLRTSFGVVSASKAYYYDTDTSQLILWDPTAMTVTSTLPVPELDPEDGERVTPTLVQRAGEVVVVASYTEGGGDRPSAEIRVAVIDTVSDEINFATSDRCGGANIGGVVVQPDGTIYVASGSLAAGHHRVGTAGSFAPCVRRIQPGATEFDPDFELELASLAGGSAGADFVDGPGSSVFVLGLDEELANLSDDADARDVTSASAWRLYRVADPGSAEPVGERVDGFEPSTGLISAFTVDDRTHLGAVGFLGQSTSISVVEDAGGIEQGMTAPGLVLDVLALPSAEEAGDVEAPVS